MTGNFTLAEHRNTFGGLIYDSDFNEYPNSLSDIASRIVSDWKFDEQCMKNIENNKKRNKVVNK